MSVAATHTLGRRWSGGQPRPFWLIVFACGLAGASAALLALQREELALVAILAPMLAALIAWRPVIGFSVLIAGAFILDQYDPTNRRLLLSAQIRFWNAFNNFSGIPLRLSPAEVLMLTTYAILIFRRGHARQRPLIPTGALIVPIGIFAAALGFGMWRGLTYQHPLIAQGFSMDAALAEIRAMLYIPIVYLLTYAVVDTPRRARFLVWLVIVAVGLTVLQAGWVTLQLGWGVFDLNEIAVHEASMFWNGLIVLLIGLAIFRGPVRQRRVLLALLPIIIVALVANQRRAGFAALGLALAVGAAMLSTDPRLRRRVVWTSLILAVVLGSYGAAFWQAEESPLTMPVYAFRSIYEPDEKDLWSNLWRQLENQNLEYTIRLSPLLGLGFGHPLVMWIELPPNYEFLLTFTYWEYITHNAIYWLWFKLGAVGFIAYWYLIGTSIILANIAFRRLQDGQLKALTLMAVGLIVMLVVFAYADLGMTSPKAMVVMGFLFGLVASLYRFALHMHEEGPTPDPSGARA